MDLALLNFLQQQQMNRPQGNNPGMGNIPDTVNISNSLPVNSMPQNGNARGQSSYNPFDIGISRAIEAARQSLGMTREQKDTALRNSLLTFADNMSGQPRARGFWNNFAAVGRALSPAMRTYDQFESDALTQNNQLANQILAQQAAEEARHSAAEQQGWYRDLAERQFAESVRNHNLLDNFRKKDSTQTPSSQEGVIEIGGIPFRSLDKVELRKINDTKTATGNTALALEEINKTWQELQSNTEDNLIPALGGFSNFANPIKDAVGRYINNEELKDETALRKKLAAQLGNLNVVLERAKTGKGLGQGMYDRLKDNFPNVEKDDLQTFQAKLDYINKEVELYNKAAQLSAYYGVRIDPADVLKLENNSNENSSDDDLGFRVSGDK